MNKLEIIRSWANSSRSRLKEYGLQHLVKIVETVNSRGPYTFRPNMDNIRAYTFRSAALFVIAIKDAILILKEQKKQGWCLIKPPIRTDRITPINQGKCMFIQLCRWHGGIPSCMFSCDYYASKVQLIFRFERIVFGRFK